MKNSELLDFLKSSFEGDYAAHGAAWVVDNGVLSELYDVVTPAYDGSVSRVDYDRIVFRGAYILEYVFFNRRDLFRPFEERFFVDFPSAVNGSARRHFCKMMFYLISERGDEISDDRLDAIAAACAEWVSDVRTRVAVKIWAIEILFLISARVSWVCDLLPELLEPLSREPSPAMRVRLARWRKNYNGLEHD